MSDPRPEAANPVVTAPNRVPIANATSVPRVIVDFMWFKGVKICEYFLGFSSDTIDKAFDDQQNGKHG
jgi:hypothetical protein